MTHPVVVGIVIGSDSDLDTMLETVKVLDALDVGSEVVVASAHRTPRRTEEWASGAAARGLRVLIAAAGGAAALPGVVAAFSSLPVIGVPLAATPLNGMDALLSIVQMPQGRAGGHGRHRLVGRRQRRPAGRPDPGARRRRAGRAAGRLSQARWPPRSTSGRSAWPRSFARDRRPR